MTKGNSHLEITFPQICCHWSTLYCLDFRIGEETKAIQISNPLHVVWFSSVEASWDLPLVLSALKAHDDESECGIIFTHFAKYFILWKFIELLMILSPLFFYNRLIFSLTSTFLFYFLKYFHNFILQLLSGDFHFSCSVFNFQKITFISLIILLYLLLHGCFLWQYYLTIFHMVSFSESFWILFLFTVYFGFHLFLKVYVHQLSSDLWLSAHIWEQNIKAPLGSSEYIDGAYWMWASV